MQDATASTDQQKPAYSARWQELDDSRRKYLHFWGDQPNSRGTIYIVHGLGEHGGRYARLADAFCKQGFRVIAFDQQGHGHSPERRGCIESYDSLLDDIGALLQWGARDGQAAPHILFGHSMGGNLVLNYALRKPYLPHAVISSSPMIRAARPPGPLFERAARILLRIAPNLRIKSSPRVERLMSDPDEQELLRQDAMFHAQLSLRLGGALLDTGRWALQNAHRLKIPTLLSHGTQDDLTCPQASLEFAQRAGEHCRLQLLPDELHDPFRGLDREAVIHSFVEFLHPFVPKASR